MAVNRYLLLWGLVLILLGTAVSSAQSQSRLSSISLTRAVSDGGDLCGLDADGRVHCWEGLTSGRPSSSPAPYSPFQSLRFRALRIAVLHAVWVGCALSPDDLVHCWSPLLGGSMGGAPVRVSGDLRLSAVTVGENHACGLSSSGEAYCWGMGTPHSRNLLGVGDGDRGSPASASPQRVRLPQGQKFREIEAGPSHTCALDQAGRAYCWGSRAFGRTGSGRRSDGAQLVPEPVVGGLSFTMLSVGNDFTCGVTTSGEAYCWGEDHRGALGQGSISKTCVLSGGAEAPCSLQPVLVTGGIRFRTVSAGAFHACGIATDGRVYCWGGSDVGQIGAETAERCYPLARMDEAYRAFAAGTSDPAVKESLQKKLNEMEAQRFPCSTRPLPVEGAPKLVSIEAGGLRTCGLTEDGRLFCWGAIETRSDQKGTTRPALIGG